MFIQKSLRIYQVAASLLKVAANPCVYRTTSVPSLGRRMLFCRNARPDTRELLDEARKIANDSGIKNPNNYNRINSPGAKY